jgi:thioredoxin-dependent peroxiredoxin
MASLKVGDLAPAFALPAAGGTTISLSDFRGKKVILYFYPKDDTSGCTKEACAFRDTISILKKKGVVIIGASIDSVASHDKFTAKYKLPFPLVCDEEKDLVKKYGVWKEKSMYGRKYMGIERTTFLIDEKGRIAHIFPKVKVDGHVDEILSVL